MTVSITVKDKQVNSLLFLRVCAASPKGAVLVYLVAVILVAGVLGAAMVSLTTTSTFSQLGYNPSEQARFLAISGQQYAKAMIRHGDVHFFDELDQNDGLMEKKLQLPGGEITITITSGAEAGLFFISSIGTAHSGSARKSMFETGSAPFYFVPGGDPASDEVVDFIVDESVFVYGSNLGFSGSQVQGPDATIVIREGLETGDLNRGAEIAVSTIYIGDSVVLDGGSASLGSATNPGAIYINGDLQIWGGRRDIYGDVFVDGDLRLKDAVIHGNIYVNGDVELGWTPTLSQDTNIYYTGTLTHPNHYNTSILDRCVWQESVAGFTMPDFGMPEPRPDSWYADRGYVSDGVLDNGLRIYAENYTSDQWSEWVDDVVVISTGDISITALGGSGLRGVLVAPYGSVTFGGGFFEGVVIARDGFFVTSGGTTVTFVNIADFFPNSSDIPIQ